MVAPSRGYKQSVTDRNALTVGSSPPPSFETLCFFTSLSEKLHMLLTPSPPRLLSVRLTHSPLRGPVLFSFGLKEVKGSYLSWEEITAPWGADSRHSLLPPREASRLISAAAGRGSRPPVPGGKGEMRRAFLPKHWGEWVCLLFLSEPTHPVQVKAEGALPG